MINQKCIRQQTEVDLQFVKHTNEAAKPLPGWAVLQPGDILINSTGTGTLGRVGWLREAAGRMTLDTHVTLVRPDPKRVRSAYLGWFLHAHEPLLIAAATGSTNQKELSRTTVGAVEIPLPSLEEQDLILQQIEARLIRIAAGAEHVMTCGALLDSYGEAVEQRAIRGELPDGLGPPQSSSSVAGAMDSTTEPYSAWPRTTLGELATEITSGSRDWRPYYNRGSDVFLLAGNVRMRHLDLSEPFFVDPPRDDPARRRSEVRKDDLLITIVGANVGMLARVPEELPRHYVCQSVALVRLKDPSLSRYLELYLSAQAGGQAFFSSRFYGQGRPHLNFKDIRETPVPLPPPEERDRVVAVIEAHTDEQRQITKSISTVQAGAVALRRSVLAAAFSGRRAAGDTEHENG